MSKTRFLKTDSLANTSFLTKKLFFEQQIVVFLQVNKNIYFENVFEFQNKKFFSEKKGEF